MRRSNAARAALVLAVATLASCDVTDGMLRHPAPAPLPAVNPSPDAASIGAVLQLMAGLHQNDLARQAESFQAAKDAADLTPTTSNRLRYAMALATPGHSGSDPVAAQRQLSELLARPETLLPMERWLAQVQLQEVEQRLILQAENKRLREETLRESRDRQQSTSRRLQAEMDENARLRKALDEAQAKLEAVTHLEHSINDRGPDGNRKR